jgi:hypothetical protein
MGMQSVRVSHRSRRVAKGVTSVLFPVVVLACSASGSGSGSFDASVPFGSSSTGASSVVFSFPSSTGLILSTGPLSTASVPTGVTSTGPGSSTGPSKGTGGSTRSTTPESSTSETTTTSGSSTPSETSTRSETSTPSETSTRSSSTSHTGTGTGTGSTSCRKPPKLFPETAAGVFCPYSSATGADDTTCAAGQLCCEPETGTSACQTAACATADISWQCLEAIDCAQSSGGSVCCGIGTLVTEPACGSEPAYAHATAFKGTVCARSCGAGQFEVCEKTSDCASTETCVATEAEGGDFGHCSTNGM